MSRFFYFGLLATLTGMLPGCHIEFANPLSGPADTKSDARLSGTWTMKGQHEGEMVYLHLGKGKSAPVNAVWVVHEKSGQMRLAAFHVFPTEINDQSYASVHIADPNNPKKHEASFFLIKYSIDANQRLTLWDLDLELRAAVSENKLKTDKGWVTDSTSKLRHFVASAKPEELFSLTENLLFEKVVTK